VPGHGVRSVRAARTGSTWSTSVSTSRRRWRSPNRV